MRRVILESPYAGNVEENVAYARAAVRDSLLRGEAPIASHLLYLLRVLGRLQLGLLHLLGVSSALSSQISGAINGTTTMKQAFSNMAKSMMEDAAKFALKWITEHAFAVASNMAANNTLTAATLAGDAAKTASAAASGAAGIASQAANATASIGIDAAKTFGGVFGFLAPLLGPFAAGPAAGAEATVLSAGAAFDTGAWELPRDMIAASIRAK